MKTKILLASMVLPTLFAACTAEDLVQNQNVGTALEDRALLDPLTINVSDETPVTRFSWNEATGGWNDFTANDKFSAGLVDAAGAVGDDVYTNYVYSSADGVSYTTTSQMVEGVYMFYSYKGFETSASRGTVDFNLTAQTADLADPTKTVEENQLFVTPLYKLEAENANDNLNMKFVSYWSTAAIKIQNASEAPFKIVRMVLNGSFDAKGSLSPDEMNRANYVYTYDKDTQAFVLDAANAGKESQKTYEDFLTADIAVSTPTTELVLDCGSYEVEAGKEVMAYMQVPAGKYTADMTVDIVVETTDSKGASILKQLEAEVVKNEKSKADKAENDQTAMYRGQTTALFGYNDDKTPKAYKIDKIALLSAPDAAGAYASSFDDVYKYVTEADKSEHDAVSNALEIYNIGDVKVDDEMVDLLSRMGVVVKFANPIDIELESTANTTVKNIVFAGDVTLKKGSVTLNGNIQTEADATLTISEGTSLKVTSATLNGSVVNNGALELGTATMPSVKFGKSSSLVVSYAGAVEWVLPADESFPKTVTISKGATLKGASGKVITIPYTSTVTVADGGTLGDVTATYVVNNGTIINNGTIKNITNENNAAVATNKVKATITNNKKIMEVTLNSGLIVMNNENASIGTVTGNGGEIDNTKDAFITDAGSNATVYVVYTGEKKGKLGQEQECNTIIFEDGTWTDPEFAADVKTFMADNVKIVKLDADGNIDVTGLTWSTITSLTLTNCTVDANLATADITDADNLVLDGTIFNGTLGLGNTAVDLNLVGVTFNGEVTANNVSTIKINPITTATGTVAATTKVNAKVSSNASTTITVAKKATLDVTVNGEIGGNSGTITGEGTVNNRGTIRATNNNATGTWNGAAPVNS